MPTNTPEIKELVFSAYLSAVPSSRIIRVGSKKKKKSKSRGSHSEPRADPEQRVQSKNSRIPFEPVVHLEQ